MIKNSSLRNILLIIVISLFFLWPLFKPGFYESHDGEAHAARFAGYYKAFADGQIYPRWAGDLNYGYGSPLFIFFYQLPYYLGSLLHFFGFGFEEAFKILIGISFLLAPLSFYAFASKLFRHHIAFVGALLYGLAPYHFLDIYVRGDIGEIMAFVFLPLVFWAIEKKSFMGSIFYALLIISHHGVGLIFTPVFLIYAVFRVKAFFMLGLGLIISAYFWVPALYESMYIQKNLFENFFKEHFITIPQLIYSPWGFGADVNREGGLAPQIGPLLFLLVLIALLKRGVIKKQIVRFWFFVFMIGVFFTNSISLFLWERIPLLADLQFPWRFTALASFAGVLLACYGLEKISKKFIVLITLLLFITSLHLTKINESVKKGDEYYSSFQGATYHHGEATTIWTAGDPGKKAEQQLEVIAGEASVSKVMKKSNRHTFIVNAKTESRILDNTVYFPGWRVEVDGKKVPIEFQDINHRGLITFFVPSGEHKIEVKFGESPIRLFSDIISIAALIFVSGVWFFKKKLNYF